MVSEVVSALLKYFVLSKSNLVTTTFVFPFVSYFLRIKILRPKYEGNPMRKTLRNSRMRGGGSCGICPIGEIIV
jgi:hypothetical protein